MPNQSQYHVFEEGDTSVCQVMLAYYANTDHVRVGRNFGVHDMCVKALLDFKTCANLTNICSVF